MAERGLAALAFDFRGWGRSGGDRRQFEDPARKVEDIEAALGFLATHPAVDATRLGGLGICVGAGYMAHAAARAPAMRALALVAPWLHDRAVLEETYGGAAGVDALLRAGDEAEARFRKTGRQTFVPIASRTDRGALMFDVPYYTEPDRGLVPDWRNEADPAFWRGWLEFDGIAIAPAVARPVLLVHSEAAAIPQGARRFFEGLAGPKEALWLEGVPQFDFYDADGPVTPRRMRPWRTSGAGWRPAGRRRDEPVRPPAQPPAGAAGRRRGRARRDRRGGRRHRPVRRPARLAAAGAPARAAGRARLHQPVRRPARGPGTGRTAGTVAGTAAGLRRHQPLVTNTHVEGAGAVATAPRHVRATHWIGTESWTVGGIYTHRLERGADGWRVTRMRLQRLYEEGDRGLVERAARRAAAAR
ncbi:serine aminopeptidase domain-containing protein [Pseudoxanthomonas taiwanensis]|uniref:Alpha/beta fold hydrolase n=1 Tax=Pseudoxanthomonas taiwanensis TaxID=176598 RepID=A0A921TER0_9GAMM|nr:alpha/beta hydrolase [Pseudoxanthomonas taiwanensis]KAF1686804.1 hypothetical protein CR938_11940 [Pseudoxanthomonas taiwanensis]